jgi:cation diffusion facilitator family transporter
VVAGAIGVLAGYPLADPIVGLLITVAILVVLRGAARDIYRRVMDAVDPHLVDAAEASLRSVPGVRDVEDLRLRWIGHRIRAEIDLAVDGRLTLAEAHRIAHEAQHRLLHDLPGLSDATVHVSPAAADGLAAHETVAHHGLPAARADTAPAR